MPGIRCKLALLQFLQIVILNKYSWRARRGALFFAQLDVASPCAYSVKKQESCSGDSGLTVARISWIVLLCTPCYSSYTSKLLSLKQHRGLDHAQSCERKSR